MPRRSEGPVLRLRLLGPLRLTDADGTDIAPTGAKARALIALLGAAPDRTRGRRWLQETLWSDRGPEQAAASLRQALIEARRALGVHADALVADRHVVRLDPERTAVDIDAVDPGAERSGRLFFEDAAVRDPAFRRWLCAFREATLPQPEAPSSVVTPVAAPVVGPAPEAVLVEAGPIRDMADAAASQFVDLVGRALNDLAAIGLRRRDPAADLSSAAGLLLDARAFLQGDLGALNGALLSTPGGSVVWSATARFQLATDPSAADDLLRLAYEAAERATAALTQARGDEQATATALARRAVTRIFDFGDDAAAEADALLDHAIALDPRASFYAWRVMGRVIRAIERHDERRPECLEEAEAFAARALEIEPANSMALAAASNAALLLRGDARAGHELGQRSVLANPCNPFAWDSLSIAALTIGEADRAHRLQSKAHAIGHRSPIKHWWDMGCCLTATVAGRFDEARRFAEAASALTPRFRPPLRYLTAIYAHEGRVEEAHRMVARLRDMEPGFTLERMVEDPDYPSAALKRSALADRRLPLLLR